MCFTAYSGNTFKSQTFLNNHFYFAKICNGNAASISTADHIHWKQAQGLITSYEATASLQHLVLLPPFLHKHAASLRFIHPINIIGRAIISDPPSDLGERLNAERWQSGRRPPNVSAASASSQRISVGECALTDLSALFLNGDLPLGTKTL